MRFAGLNLEPGLGPAWQCWRWLPRPSLEDNSASSAKPPSPRILIVDDEEGVRRSTGRVLRRSGYAVEEAADGEKALALLGRAEGPFDLVLSDLVMPRMGGLALFERLRARADDTRVLLMSGYTAEDARALDQAQPGLKVLHKPWTIADLLRRVRAILDEPASAPPQ